MDKALGDLGTPEALALRGRAAIANSRLVYRRFREIFDGETFAPLRARGARPQRPLWASTSTKNPDYRDVIYVEELVAPDTVNTMPPATLDAFRDHGEVRGATAAEAAGAARQALDDLRRLGIDLDEITERLQRDGVASFAQSYDDLIAALRAKRASCSSTASAARSWRWARPARPSRRASLPGSRRACLGASGRRTTPSGRPCPCRS